MNSGKLIATLEPLRLRIFAVRVLKRINLCSAQDLRRGHQRETCMGVCDLFRNKQAMAREGILWVKVRLGEDTLDA